MSIATRYPWAVVLAALALGAPAARGQLTSIDQIQTYNAISGAATPIPPLGTEVTVEGTLYVVKGQFNAGTHYIMGDDGGIQCFHSDAALGVVGDRIQVTGTIATFSAEIQLFPVSAWTYVSHPGEPAPTEYAIPALIHQTSGYPGFTCDYEAVGRLIRVTGVVATEPVYRSPTVETFGLRADGDTLTVTVHTWEAIDLSAVTVGEKFQVTGACVKYNSVVEIRPRRQDDLVDLGPLAGEGATWGSVKRLYGR